MCPPELRPSVSWVVKVGFNFFNKKVVIFFPDLIGSKVYETSNMKMRIFRFAELNNKMMTFNRKSRKSLKTFNETIFIENNRGINIIKF